MEYLYLQNPTSQTSQEEHSYSSGMIQASSCFYKQVCLETICMWICWSLNFCWQIQFENMQKCSDTGNSQIYFKKEITFKICEFSNKSSDGNKASQGTWLIYLDLLFV